MVIKEPDAWLVNLADCTAKHIVDPGPTFNCKLPIFTLSAEMAKSKVGELEIGREIDFFHQNSAKLIEGPKVQLVPFKAALFAKPEGIKVEEAK